MREAGYEPLRDRFAHADENDRRGDTCRLHRAQRRAGVDDDHVRHEPPQLCGDGARPFGIEGAPEVIDRDVAAGHPSGAFKALPERRGAGLALRVVLRIEHQDGDAPNPRRLLRAGRERPCRHRATDQFEELTPLHAAPPKISSAIYRL